MAMTAMPASSRSSMAVAGPQWSTVGSDIFHGNDAAPFGSGNFLDEAEEEDEQHHIFSAMIQAGQESASVSGRSSRTSGDASSSSASAKRDKRKSPPEQLQSKGSGRRHPWSLGFSIPTSQRIPPPTGPPPAAPGGDGVEYVDEARTPTTSTAAAVNAAARDRRPRNFSRPERHADRASKHVRTTSEAETNMEPAWDDDQSCIDSSPLVDSDPFKAQAPRIVPTLSDMELQRQSAAQLERERDRLRESMMSPVGSERLGRQGDPAEAFEVAALRRQVEQLQMALRQRSADSFSPSSSSGTFGPMSPPHSKALLAPYLAHTAHLGPGGLPTPTDSRSAASSRHSPRSKGGYTSSPAPNDFETRSNHMGHHTASLLAHHLPPHSLAPAPQLTPQQMAAYEQLYGMPPPPPSLAHYAFGGPPVTSAAVHHHPHLALAPSPLPYLASPVPAAPHLSSSEEHTPSPSLQHHMALMEEVNTVLYGPDSPRALKNLQPSPAPEPAPAPAQVPPPAPASSAAEQGKLDELTAKIEALERLFRRQASVTPSEAPSSKTATEADSKLRPASSVISDGRRASTSFLTQPSSSVSQAGQQPQAQHAAHARLQHASGLPRSPSLSDINTDSVKGGSLRPRSPAMSAFNFNATSPYGGRSLFASTSSSIGSSEGSRNGAAPGAAMRRKAVARFILGVGSARRPEGGVALDLHAAQDKASGPVKMKRGPGRGMIRVAPKT